MPCRDHHAGLRPICCRQTGIDVTRLVERIADYKKVLAAVPEEKRHFRLDPKSRTDEELVWHLTPSDVQMLDEIADHKFSMEPRFKDEPKTIADIVTW